MSVSPFEFQITCCGKEYGFEKDIEDGVQSVKIECPNCKKEFLFERQGGEFYLLCNRNPHSEDVRKFISNMQAAQKATREHNLHFKKSLDSEGEEEKEM